MSKYPHFRVRRYIKEGKGITFKDHIFNCLSKAEEFIEELIDDVVKVFDIDDQPIEFKDKRKRSHQSHRHGGRHGHGHKRDDGDYEYL